MSVKKPIVVDNVSRSFLVKNGEKIVLDKCSFEIENGTIFGLVGLNGIGKTTLIKIIFDLISADYGTIKLFDLDNRDFNSRKNVCYLPEKFQPSQYLTGYDFLEISLSFFNRELNKKDAQQISEAIDLDPSVLSIKTGKYSKGMGQKLGLVSCFLSGAELLVLDEPMSGLDPRSRIMLKDVLKSYKDFGKSIFFSSHILEDIDEICDDLVVLHDREVKFRGSPEEMKLKYNSHNAERAFLNCITS